MASKCTGACVWALLLLQALDNRAAGEQQGLMGVDWPSFLRRSDPVNTFRASEPMTLPDSWLEASFAGNAMVGTQVMVCPGGVCRQSLLTGSNSTLPPPSAPLQVVLPVARGDVSDIRSGNASKVCIEFREDPRPGFNPPSRRAGSRVVTRPNFPACPLREASRRSSFTPGRAHPPTSSSAATTSTRRPPPPNISDPVL